MTNKSHLFDNDEFMVKLTHLINFYYPEVVIRIHDLGHDLNTLDEDYDPMFLIMARNKRDSDLR